MFMLMIIKESINRSSRFNRNNTKYPFNFLNVSRAHVGYISGDLIILFRQSFIEFHFELTAQTASHFASYAKVLP